MTTDDPVINVGWYERDGYTVASMYAGPFEEWLVPPAGEAYARMVQRWKRQVQVSVSPTGSSVRVWVDGGVEGVPGGTGTGGRMSERRDYKFAIGYEDKPGERAYRMSGDVPWTEDPREYVLRMQDSYGVKDDPTAFAELTTTVTCISTENLLEET